GGAVGAGGHGPAGGLELAGDGAAVDDHGVAVDEEDGGAGPESEADVLRRQVADGDRVAVQQCEQCGQGGDQQILVGAGVGQAQAVGEPGAVEQVLDLGGPGAGRGPGGAGQEELRWQDAHEETVGSVLGVGDDGLGPGGGAQQQVAVVQGHPVTDADLCVQ